MTEIIGTPAVSEEGFATVAEVATRLGRDLTSDEQGSVALLIQLATATIANAADKTEEWAAELDPIPLILKGFCIELVCRTFANPMGLFSESKTLGSFQHSQSFNKDVSSAMALSDVEVLVIRRAVRGTNAGSARAESTADLLSYCEEEDELQGS
jgi:hypothetical protein